MREFVDWTIHWTDELPEEFDGMTRWSDRTIWLRRGLSQVQRRVLIEHERQHLIRGPGGCVVVEERAVEIATAHVLVRLDDLIEAAKWARSLPELADELNVTQEVVQVRLMHLHPSERAKLKRATARDEVSEDEQEGAA